MSARLGFFAVLVQAADRQSHTVCYASRRLCATERRYSQTEKQVLKEAPKEVTGNVLRVIWCPTYIPPPPSRPTRLHERAWRDITADFITPGVSPAELFFKRKVRLPN